MNERIRQLAVEAFFDEATNVSTDKMYHFGEAKMQLFAELIVQECAMTIQDFVDHRIPASEYPRRLKQQFGVE